MRHRVIKSSPGIYDNRIFINNNRMMSPETKVVVVGKGINGKGEEGRLAWILIRLGIQDVQFASVNYFKAQLTSEESLPLKSKPMWKPNKILSIEADKKEVIKAITGNSKGKIHIVDVRSKNEYFSRTGFGEDYATPNLNTIHVEWKEFFDAYGRPNFNIKKQLKAVGIHPRDRVLTLSNKGVRSAAVTMALLSMGYKKAANYSGGLKEIQSIK